MHSLTNAQCTKLSVITFSMKLSTKQRVTSKVWPNKAYKYAVVNFRFSA